MLRSYEVFLNKKGTVKTQYVPFYLKWVSDCYGFLDGPLSKCLSIEQKRQFLLNMAKRHEDWKVRQADTPLRLYDYFLLENITQTTGETSFNKESWGLLQETMGEAPETSAQIL
jgi:hypothetical protein